MNIELTLCATLSSSRAFASRASPASRFAAARSTNRPKPAEALVESTTRQLQPGYSSSSAAAAVRALPQDPDIAAAREMCSTGVPASASGRQNSMNSSGFIWLVRAMPPARIKS